MNATDARKISIANSVDMREIYEKIKLAALSGKTDVCLSFGSHETITRDDRVRVVVSKLKSDGYSASYRFEQNYLKLTIEW